MNIGVQVVVHCMVPGEQTSEQACSKGQVFVLNRVWKMFRPNLMKQRLSFKPYDLFAEVSFKIAIVSKRI